MKIIRFWIYFFIFIATTGLANPPATFPSLQWCKTVVMAANEYFRLPYREATEKDGFYKLEYSGKTVFRPNHPVHHAARQLLFSVNIALEFQQATENLFSSKEGVLLFNWIINKLKSDKHFLEKVAFAAAFQRSGRQSEVDRDVNKEASTRYLQADQDNFKAKVAGYVGPGRLFTNQEEVGIYAQALALDKTKHETLPEDVFFLLRIFNAAHQLDLRRIPQYDKKKILTRISNELFCKKFEDLNESERQLILRLWVRSGYYLVATGDRDMDDHDSQKDPSGWRDLATFVNQAEHPEILVEALQRANMVADWVQELAHPIYNESNTNGEIGLAKSFLSQFKPQDLKDTEESQRLQSELANAPYTASEGYLRMCLGENYKEIPPGATEQEIRAIILENIRAFLCGADRSNQPGIAKERIANPDDYYVNLLADMMMEERKQEETSEGRHPWIVLYHATEAPIAFLYDLYTEIHRQMSMIADKDVMYLRGTDMTFTSLDDDLRASLTNCDTGPIGFMKGFMNSSSFEKQVKEYQDHPQADARYFMSKIRSSKVDDTDPKYGKAALSANFALFGCDGKEHSDSYNMFYKVKDGSVIFNQVEYKNLLQNFIQETGIPIDIKECEKILQDCGLTGEGANRNGVMMQVFINLLILDKVAYFSVANGRNIQKDGRIIFSLAEAVKLLRLNPLEFKTYISTLTTDYSPISDGCERKVTLRDPEGRLFLRPENSNSINIKFYWRLPLSSEQIDSYHAAIKELVRKSLVKWLKEGAKSQEGAFVPETDRLKVLPKIMETYGIVDHGVFKSEPIPVIERFKGTLENEMVDRAAKILSEEYDSLRRYIPGDTEAEKESNLRDLIKQHPFPAVVKLAFEKGIFKGGKRAYDIFEVMTEGVTERQEFLNVLTDLNDSPKDLDETLTLFYHYYVYGKDSLNESIDDQSEAKTKALLVALVNTRVNIPRVLRDIYQTKAILGEGYGGPLKYIPGDTSANKASSLRDLIKQHPFPVVVKLAFEKGVFKGGKRAYDIFELMSEKTPFFLGEFLSVLSELNDSPNDLDKTFDLFYHYYVDVPYGKKSLKESIADAQSEAKTKTALRDLLNELIDIPKILRDINTVGNNDESLIKFVAQLYVSNNYNGHHVFIFFFSSLQPDRREAVKDEYLNLVSRVPLKSDGRVESHLALAALIQERQFDQEAKDKIYGVLQEKEGAAYFTDLLVGLLENNRKEKNIDNILKLPSLMLEKSFPDCFCMRISNSVKAYGYDNNGLIQALCNLLQNKFNHDDMYKKLEQIESRQSSFTQALRDQSGGWCTVLSSGSATPPPLPPSGSGGKVFQPKGNSKNSATPKVLIKEDSPPHNGVSFKGDDRTALKLRGKVFEPLNPRSSVADTPDYQQVRKQNNDLVKEVSANSKLNPDMKQWFLYILDLIKGVIPSQASSHNEENGYLHDRFKDSSLDDLINREINYDHSQATLPIQKPVTFRPRFYMPSIFGITGGSF